MNAQLPLRYHKVSTEELLAAHPCEQDVVTLGAIVHPYSPDNATNDSER